uniref:Uncharacterized protein n=1 Tax=Thermogemmatispora argillosa TaxID=2045280 RepID=A0A455T6A8_9CHLR|nr:hypothetical protein KTA_25140 [Thermogemmatispora argillosa]
MWCQRGKLADWLSALVCSVAVRAVLADSAGWTWLKGMEGLAAVALLYPLFAAGLSFRLRLACVSGPVRQGRYKPIKMGPSVTAVDCHEEGLSHAKKARKEVS